MLTLILLSVLIQSLILMVPSTRSECNRTRFEEICNNNININWRMNYLLSDLSDHGRVVNINCVSQRWFHSPDGVNYTVLNSSSSKYMIANDNNNLLRIHFSNVSASDEGIYGCLDGTNDRIQSYVGCLKVYGAIAFASEETETLALPANGGSVSFNATVIYKPGGSCNYRQNLKLIKLKKINESTEDRLMYTCKFENPCISNEETAVNLSRGHLGSEFVLTLFNVTANSIGTYEVIVESSHPGRGGIQEFTKSFHLVARSSTPSSSSKTMIMTSTPTVLSTSSKTVIMTSTPTVLPTPVTVGGATPTLPLIVGIVIGVTILMTVFTIIIIVTILIKARSRKRVGSGSTSEQSNHESHTYNQLHSQAEQARHNGGETVIYIQHNGSGNEETNIIVTREESVTSMELPPNSDTISTIDNIELPNNDQINSHAVPC